MYKQPYDDYENSEESSDSNNYLAQRAGYTTDPFAKKGMTDPFSSKGRVDPFSRTGGPTGGMKKKDPYDFSYTMGPKKVNPTAINFNDYGGKKEDDPYNIDLNINKKKKYFEKDEDKDDDFDNLESSSEEQNKKKKTGNFYDDIDFGDNDNKKEKDKKNKKKKTEEKSEDAESFSQSQSEKGKEKEKKKKDELDIDIDFDFNKKEKPKPKEEEEKEETKKEAEEENNFNANNNNDEMDDIAFILSKTKKDMDKLKEDYEKEQEEDFDEEENKSKSKIEEEKKVDRNEITESNNYDDFEKDKSKELSKSKDENMKDSYQSKEDFKESTKKEENKTPKKEEKPTSNDYADSSEKYKNDFAESSGKYKNDLGESSGKYNDFETSNNPALKTSNEKDVLNSNSKYNDFETSNNLKKSNEEEKKTPNLSNVRLSNYSEKNDEIDEEIKSQVSERENKNKEQQYLNTKSDDYGGFDNIASSNFDKTSINKDKKQQLAESSGNFSERYKNLIGTSESNNFESSGKFDNKNEKKPPVNNAKTIKEDFNDSYSVSSENSQNKSKNKQTNENKSNQNISGNNSNNNNNNNQGISTNSAKIHALVQNAIENYIKNGEFEQMLNSNNNMNLMSNNSLNNNQGFGTFSNNNNINPNYSYDNDAGINQADQEFGKIMKNQNALHRDGDLRKIKFDFAKLRIIKVKTISIDPSFNHAQKESLKSLKLETQLAEEESKRILTENRCKSLTETKIKLEEEIRRLNQIKFENIELRKSANENAAIIQDMKNSFEDIKKEYEEQLKMIEDRINSRESEIYNTRVNDMEKRFQLDILKKNYEIETANKQIDFLKNRNKVIEEENLKLKASEDNSEKVKNLEKENFILQEKFNLVSKERDKLEIEIHKLKMQSVNYSAPIDESAGTNVNNENQNSQIVNYNASSSIQGKKQGGKLAAESSQYFDKVMYEKEFAAQEKLLNAYVKEIENLNKEIAFLKSIPACHSKLVNPSSKQININSSLKQSAEEQIKKLQKFLLQKSKGPNNNNPNSKTYMEIMEKNFLSIQQAQNQTNPNSGNEISFDNFMIVMRDLETPLSSNELIEVFNNFERVNGNRIRLTDFMGALNSSAPSTFFIQNDPPFLNLIEQKLVKAQSRVKELEKFIINNHGENEELKKRNQLLEEENKQLKEKVNETNIQMLNYFLTKGDKDAKGLVNDNSEYKVISEKFKSLEKDKIYQNEQLEQKFGAFNKKIEQMKNDFDKRKSNLEHECAAEKQKVVDLENEKVIMQRDFDSKEKALKEEIQKLNEKLEKYKKNFGLIKAQKEEIINEKERVLNCLNEKGVSAEKILAFCNCSDDVKVLLSKIDNLQKKNEDREERYKKICIESSREKIKKEIEKVRKQYEEEKNELISVIQQRNLEIKKIKVEFEDMMLELERIKASGKYK